MRIGKTLVLAVLISAAAAYFLAGEAYAAGVKATGTLTEVRENGKVMIDGYGYAMSHSVKVVDGQGRLISVDELVLPTVIQYEYAYRKGEGPAIKVIRELPQ